MCNTTEIERAKELLRAEAAPEVYAGAENLVGDELATWILDPYVKGCVALVELPARRQALVVVYGLDTTEPTWELDESFEDALWGEG